VRARAAAQARQGPRRPRQTGAWCTGLADDAPRPSTRHLPVALYTVCVRPGVVTRSSGGTPGSLDRPHGTGVPVSVGR
jgi:hypothetical protein